MRESTDVTFRNTPHLPEIDALVRLEAAKLERYGPELIACRVAIERPRNGNA
jgi:hypothetical protein